MFEHTQTFQIWYPTISASYLFPLTERLVKSLGLEQQLKLIYNTQSNINVDILWQFDFGKSPEIYRDRSRVEGFESQRHLRFLNSWKRTGSTTSL